MGEMRRNLLVGSLPVAIAVTFLLGFTLSEDGARPSAHPLAGLTPEQSRLVDLLDRYHRTWRPDRRAAVLEDFRKQRDSLTGPLRWLLGHDDHPLLEVAVEVAGRAGFAELRPRVLWLALEGPAAVRPAAICAAARLSGFDAPELEPLLQEPDPSVQAAAVEAWGIRALSPAHAILPLLASPHPRVRQAVLEALPPELDEEELERLLSLAAGSETEARDSALRALAGRADPPEAEEVLVRIASESEPQASAMALDVLATRRQPLTDPAELWNLATDPHRPLGLRLQAMLCLERTRSPLADTVQRELVYLEPALRYAAGRYLLALGRRHGAEVLLELLEELERGPSAVQGKLATSLVHDTRRILALVSGEPIETSLDHWREWYAGDGRLLSRPLPEPALWLGESTLSDR